MARTRTTKAVAQRIDLNYFKRPTPYKRTKLWLAVLAPAAALLWIGWHFLGRDNHVYSSGQLSGAHAVLEKQCEACHVQEAGGYSAKAADAACLACHDGPAHHPEVMVGGAPKPACSECHVEHRGKTQLLAATGWQACAQCHSGLRRVSKETNYAPHIWTLDAGHPEFKILMDTPKGKASDPGTIKLNHALHMKTIRRGPNGPMVQLDCSDCHRPSQTTNAHWEYGDANYAAAQVSYTSKESFEPGGTMGLARKQPWSDRQLMAPVKFANACAGCHLLSFDRRFDEGAPHDRPDVVHAFLEKKFADYIARHPNELQEIQNPQRNLAGRAAGIAARTVSAGQWISEQVAASEELLWHKTCAQCHTVSATPLQDVKIARWDASGTNTGKVERARAWDASGKPPMVEAAHTRLQWLPHSRFDHDAHTGFSCVSCHPNALKSSETADILIPGIKTCQACHAPGPGKAESRCSECHTYHDWSKRKEVHPAFTLPKLRGN
jgi:predicted CXXCH cytochrome family protein